jgi:hypothetical protein
MNYFASFYKCALQVNPSGYAAYRGNETEDDADYNQKILDKCCENDIKVVGMANHGDVDSSESLRNLLCANGIVVFPGFEITSAEKIHMVCLFPENKTLKQLNRYLGGMGLNNPEQGTATSSCTCIEIAQKVKEEGGFWYAAHITSDNGILKLGHYNNIWKDDLLVAAQIPDSRENVDPRYKNIINNTDPQYKRTKKPAYINACDIAKPEDLDSESATTLIKMSEPSFENFLMAFKDPDLRIRLNSEEKKGYQSAIRSLRVFGGYLDNLEVEFSDNLVTFIGGRGTGKSTIINCMRYALDMPPKEEQRKKEFDEMIKHNLGGGSRIELTVKSNAQTGKIYRIKKEYDKKPVIIEDETDTVSSLTIDQILPKIVIYGQNEIVESVREPELINSIVLSLFANDKKSQMQIDKAYDVLAQNNKELKGLETEIATLEGEVSDYCVAREKLSYYEKVGLDKKLPLIRELASEEASLNRFKASIPCSKMELRRMEEEASKENPVLKRLSEIASQYNECVKVIEEYYQRSTDWLRNEYKKLYEWWEEKKTGSEIDIKRSLTSIEGIQDKSSTEIVEEYYMLLKKVKGAESVLKEIQEKRTKVEELKKQRVDLIEGCRKAWKLYENSMNTQIKSLNKKKLKGVVRILVKFRQQKKMLIERLLKIEGVGEKSIAGIIEYKDFDVFTFAEDIRNGANQIQLKYHLTRSYAEKITKSLSEKEIRDIEEYRLPDQYIVELRVNENYKPMENLSKGQQCTAILHILLLENKDPLIIDQPEDNLDNSFIADDLITAIRDNKIRRQFIFATHNANIPVFGDAELIVAMEEKNGVGSIIKGGIGSVDVKPVKEQVIRILEGGEAAFKMREHKYGLV